jgi:hypothetical protein
MSLIMKYMTLHTHTVDRLAFHPHLSLEDTERRNYDNK